MRGESRTALNSGSGCAYIHRPVRSRRRKQLPGSTCRPERIWREPDRRLRVLIAPPVNALPEAGVRFYDDGAAARYILCIRKEALAMFANRQTPPGAAL